MASRPAPIVGAVAFRDASLGPRRINPDRPVPQAGLGNSTLRRYAVTVGFRLLSHRHYRGKFSTVLGFPFQIGWLLPVLVQNFGQKEGVCGETTGRGLNRAGLGLSGHPRPPVIVGVLGAAPDPGGQALAEIRGCR